MSMYNPLAIKDPVGRSNLAAYQPHRITGIFWPKTTDLRHWTGNCGLHAARLMTP
jgi:hypothetical protein